MNAIDIQLRQLERCKRDAIRCGDTALGRVSRTLPPALPYRLFLSHHIALRAQLA